MCVVHLSVSVKQKAFTTICMALQSDMFSLCTFWCKHRKQLKIFALNVCCLQRHQLVHITKLHIFSRASLRTYLIPMHTSRSFRMYQLSGNWMRDFCIPKSGETVWLT